MTGIEEIDKYIEIVRTEPHRVCREQKALADLAEKALAEDGIIIDTGKLADYRRLEKYFAYKLMPWELFIFTLWNCVYIRKGERVVPRFPDLFVMVGRGAGKDGFIAFDALASVSPYNKVAHYNVDICANNEEQAMTPVIDAVEVLQTPKNEAKLKKHFYWTKEVIKGRKNLGVIKGRTNNPKGRDGMRSGKIVFNEVHQFENYDNITVFTTGLGKVADPRTGIFTSNGTVNDGPLDDYLARSERILFEGEADNGFLPFICRLDDKRDVDDPANWSKANPSLPYFQWLEHEIEKEYTAWKERPDENASFMPKRMGVRVGFTDLSVTDYEKILQTKKDLPNVAGMPCTVGIDYAELSDWAAVNLHFRIGDERVDVNHAWICARSKTLGRVKAPWQAWCESGICTYVDDETISPNLLAEYIAEAGRTYAVKMLAMDNFRWTLMADALRKIGFDAADKTRVKLIRPSDIMQTDSVIQDCFDRDLFRWGDNPCLRWACNNTKRVRSSRRIGVDTGNFIYAKIEAKSRKTDAWMALVASMTCEGVLSSGVVEMPKIVAFTM